MVKKAQILDEDHQITVALRAAGFDVNSIRTEMILNIIDFIRTTKTDTTLKDVLEIK